MIAFDGVFSTLADPEVFRQVYVDTDWGTLCWPGDLDLAPEALYERVVGMTTGAAKEA